MRVWITGAAGFLGGHLYEYLIGHLGGVGGNDNMSCSPEPLPSNSPISRTDCRDSSGMCRDLLQFRPDVLVHCAALAHEGLSNFSPSFITDSIYSASVATFSAAIASGVKRIVYMSSMARYGNIIVPYNEEMFPQPVDPYGIAKVAAEQTLKSICRLHNVEYVILIPHNIIGKRQKYDDPFRNVASIMINRALQGKPILVYGDGQQKRCFSPIEDCLDSLLKSLDAPVAGETINIGPDSGEITVLELAEMIRDLTGGMAEIQHVSARPNEVANAFCSSDKARKLLGYNPKKNLRQSLAEMVLYIKEHGVKEFQYNFPVEIEDGCPEVWKQKLI